MSPPLYSVSGVKIGGIAAAVCVLLLVLPVIALYRRKKP